MAWRICSFLLCQAAAGGIGWLLAGDRGAQVGLVVGGLAWFVVDSTRALRLVRWLRRGARADLRTMAGLWGEVGERTRRVLRARDQQVLDAEARLQEFLAAIQASPNGVVLLDADGRIEWCNETVANHLGIDPSRDLEQLIGNLLRDPAFAAYSAQGDFTRDVIVPGRDNTPGRPVRVSVQLHPYGEGRKLLLSRDVTALEQAEAMRRDFVANVSHEIRTPLTVLAGFIETLQNLPLDASDRTRYLGLMAQQAVRMQTLVSDLLTLSRLEGSPLPGAGEWTSVAALLAQCEQEARSLSASLGKSLELQVEPAPADEVSGAASELLSAMSNLVSNAVRYTPSGGRVVVGWRVLGDGRGEFSVRDSGPGIVAEHIPRLTERFYRVDRSRSRETGGTGLGLAIVKHVLQRHAAELRIESTPGAGSVFSITFPGGRVRAVRRTPTGATAQPATAG
jgi:two-component system phosphate regulon sensor histidine kinase PhoR